MHFGNSRPVDIGTEVEVVCGNGKVVQNKAECIVWNPYYSLNEHDVVKYRVLSVSKSEK